jgi:hypothetical protein
MRWARTTIAALAMGCGLQAEAQREAPLSELLLPSDAAALADSTYGRATIANFADALLNSADTACRQSRKLGADQYRKAARDLFLTYFPNARKFEAAIIDSEGFRIAFEKSFGNASIVEFRAMLDDPVIRKRLSVMQPRQSEGLVIGVIEKISQAAIVDGVKLNDFGILFGDPDLLKLSERLHEEVDARLKVFDLTNPSPLSPRFKRMTDEFLSVIGAARKHEPASSHSWINASVKDIVPGLPAKLEAICLKR